MKNAYVDTVEHQAAVYSLSAPDDKFLRDLRKKSFLEWLDRHDAEEREEAQYWEEQFTLAVEALKEYRSVYEFTGARTPSPKERRRSNELQDI